MALEFDAAGRICAGPDVFVVDGVGMLGCHFDAAVGEEARTFFGPEGLLGYRKPGIGAVE